VMMTSGGDGYAAAGACAMMTMVRRRMRGGKERGREESTAEAPNLPW